jgi:hypothetical protein
MDPLKTLLNFIREKDDDNERAELRRYLFDHPRRFVEVYGVDCAAFRLAIVQVEGEREQVLKSRRRERLSSAQFEVAQRAACEIAETAFWSDELLCVDLGSLLETAITDPTDLLVFVLDADESISIPMRLLIGLQSLGLNELLAFVTPLGLHVCWRETGRLNFRSEPDRWAKRIIFTAPARSAVAA